MKKQITTNHSALVWANLDANIGEKLHLYEIAYRETYKAVKLVNNNAYTPYLDELLRHAMTNKRAVMLCLANVEADERKAHNVTRAKLGHVRRIIKRKTATVDEKSQAERDEITLSALSENENGHIKDLAHAVHLSNDFADLMHEFIIDYLFHPWRKFEGVAHAKVNAMVSNYGLRGRNAWEYICRCGVGRSAVYRAVHGERGINTIDSFTTKHFTATDDAVTRWVASHRIITNADANETPIKYRRDNGKDLESMSLKNGVIVHSIHYRTIKAHDYVIMDDHGAIKGYRRTDNRTAEKERARLDVEILKASATERERIYCDAYLSKDADEIAWNVADDYEKTHKDFKEHEPKKFARCLDTAIHKARNDYAWQVIERETGKTYDNDYRGKILRRMRKYAHHLEHLEHRDQVHNDLLESGFLHDYDTHYAQMMSNNDGLGHGQTAQRVQCFDVANLGAVRHYTDAVAWVTREQVIEREQCITVGDPWRIADPTTEQGILAYMVYCRERIETRRDAEQLAYNYTKDNPTPRPKKTAVDNTAERLERAEQMLAKIKPVQVQADPDRTRATINKSKAERKQYESISALIGKTFTIK